MSKLEDIRIGARVCASIREYSANPEMWEHYADERLRYSIAKLLQQQRPEFIKTDYMVEKRIDLYVASPEEFWRIVNKEAEKIALRFLSNGPTSCTTAKSPNEMNLQGINSAPNQSGCETV